MKNSSIKLIKLLFTAILSVICFSDLNAQVGIGVPTGEAPQATLDIRYDSAVSPGFLMPRVTVLPAGNISEGMLILYCAGCTDTDGDGAINYEGGIYYVYVDNDGDGTLEWTPLSSNAGVVEIDEQAPSAPSNLVASNPTSSTIDLSWSASTDNVSVAGYFIYFSDGTLATTAPSNSITVNGLNPSTSYTFYVTAYDAVMNESGQSNTATQITTGLPDTEAPTAPANLVASNITTSSIDLTWNASTDNVGVVGYYVYQGGVQVSDVTSSTSTTISGLSESTQYSFYVTAYDAAGNESSQSNTVTPSTTGTCVETTFCNHNFDNGQFGCWNGASGATISNGGGETYAALEGKFDPNIYSGPYDFTGFSRINVSFLAETNNAWDNSDDYFLEIKIGNGNYQQLQSWGRTTNWTSRSSNITQGQYLTQNVTIRIRSNANKNDEDVYIDNASIIGYCD